MDHVARADQGRIVNRRVILLLEIELGHWPPRLEMKTAAKVSTNAFGTG